LLPDTARFLSTSQKEKTIKFLVIARPCPIQQGLTSAMVQETAEIVSSRIRDGTIDCLYNFANGSSSFGIVNADSEEALLETLKSPASPFVELETHAFADFKRIVSNTIEAMMKKQGL
jgi:hypothetical protein